MKWKKRGTDWLWFVAGLAISPLPYLKALLNPDSALLYRDLTNVFLPLKHLWVLAIREIGRIPHWDPFHVGGIPNLADPSDGPLYPLNFFFLLFPSGATPRTLTFFVVLHHLLLFTGAYLLLSRFRIRNFIAAIGALSLAWSGYAMTTTNLLHIFCSLPAIPFFFFFWLRTLERKRPGLDLALAALFLAWPVYAGDPQISYILCLLSPLLAWRFSSAAGRALACLTALAFLAACVAAPQLLPILVHMNEMDRPAGSPFAWSLHPARLLTAIFPLSFGSAPTQEYWGWVYLNTLPWKQPFIFSFYGGLLPLIAGVPWLWAYLSKKRRHSWQVWSFVAVFVLGLFLAMGSFAPVPVYALAMKTLPWWSGFRYPERLVLWPLLLWIFCGCWGAERLLRLGRTGIRGPLPLVALVSIGVFLLSLLFMGIVIASNERSFALLLRRMVTFAVVLSVLLFVKRVPKWVIAPALVLITAFDLYRVSTNLVWTQGANAAELDGKSAVQKILEHRDVSGSGAFSLAERSANFYELYKESESLPQFADLERDVQTAWHGLRYNTGNYWGLETVQPHSSLVPRRPIISLLRGNHDEQLQASALLGVKYMIFDYDGKITAHVNQYAQSFITFPKNVRVGEDLSAVLEMAKRGELRDESHMGLEMPLPPELPLESNADWKLVSVKKSWDRIRVSILSKTAAKPGWIQINEAFHPNWTARLSNGEEREIYRANSWAMALLLPEVVDKEASLELELSYREPSFELGKKLLLIWLAVLLLALALEAYRFFPSTRKL